MSGSRSVKMRVFEPDHRGGVGDRVEFQLLVRLYTLLDVTQVVMTVTAAKNCMLELLRDQSQL